MGRRLGLVFLMLLALSGVLIWRAQSHAEGGVVSSPTLGVAAPPSVVLATARDASLAATPEAPADAVIEVHVTVDGAPARDAQVSARRQGALSISWRPTWSPPLLRRTDARGLAELSAREGVWVVTVSKDGFAATTVDLVKPAGERVTVMQVTLERGSVLRGTATDSSGRAVAPAIIRVSPVGDRPSSRRGSSAGVVETTVDARGRFQFESLAAGRWRIEGEAEGAGKADLTLIDLPSSEEVQLRFRRSGFLEGKVVFPDGGRAPDAIVSVIGIDETEVIEAGPTGTFSVERMPGDYRLSARQGERVGTAAEMAFVRAGSTTQTRIVISGRGGVLEGTVKRDDGVPIAGALVIVSPHNDDGTCARATTVDDGTWRIGSLPVGTYDVEAEANGLMHSSQRGFFVMDGSTSKAELVLGRLGKVTGVVESASGAPLSVRVMMRSLRNSFADRQAVADGAGHFIFDDVPPGPAFVRAMPTPEEPSSSVDVKVEAGATAEVKVIVVDLVALELELDRTRCVPLPAVTLTAMRTDSSAQFQKRIQRLVPKDTSRTTLQLSPGGWQVASFSETCAVMDWPKNFKIEAGVKPPLIKLVLAPLPPGLEVRVVEADGQPAPFAQVTARTEKGEWYTPADADGVASLGFDDDLSMTVSASKRGRSAQANGVRRAQGRVVLTLAPAAQIHLRLEGAQGRTQVVAELDGSLISDQLQTNGDEAWLQDIPAGSVTLTAMGSGKTMGVTRVSTSSGKTAEATIRLQPAAEIQGKVNRPAGNVSHAFVSLTSSFMADRAELKPDGTFGFDAVVPGEYTVKLECEGCVLPARSVRARPGEVVQLQFP